MTLPDKKKGRLLYMNLFTNIFLGAPMEAGAGFMGFLQSYGFIIVLVLLLVVMFVFSSRSQKKRRKQYQNMIDSLKPGSRIRTIGGIFGTVTSVKEDIVIVSVGPDKARLVFSKQAIASIEDAPVEATIDGEIRNTDNK